MDFEKHCVYVNLCIRMTTKKFKLEEIFFIFQKQNVLKFLRVSICPYIVYLTFALMGNRKANVGFLG
jgi:hypothetical protein